MVVKLISKMSSCVRPIYWTHARCRSCLWLHNCFQLIYNHHSHLTRGKIFLYFETYIYKIKIIVIIKIIIIIIIITVIIIIINILISKEIKTPTSQIKILNTGISETDLPHLYLIPFTVTSETKFSMFQYKILHNILPTKSLLYIMGKVDTPKCPHCEHESQGIKHIFLNCQCVKDFWRCFHSWYNNGGSRLNLKQTEILYGVISKTKSRSTPEPYPYSGQIPHL